MNYQTPMMQNTPGLYTLIEPYVFDALSKLNGRSVVLETVRGNLQGIIVDVKPDHIVVKSYDSDTIFYVRLQQIVYVMPN